MKDKRENTPFYARRTYRLLSGSFGAFLVGVGLYALFFEGPLTALRLAASVGLVMFGGNMAASAYAAKQSWLSRIGPLP
mgnify:CR=1 FL=1|jgi:hypothetical protein